MRNLTFIHHQHMLNTLFDWDCLYCAIPRAPNIT